MDSPISSPPIKKEKKKLSLDQAKNLLWEAGEISQFKLKGVQKDIYKEANDFSKTLYFICIILISNLL